MDNFEIVTLRNVILDAIIASKKARLEKAVGLAKNYNEHALTEAELLVVEINELAKQKSKVI